MDHLMCPDSLGRRIKRHHVLQSFEHFIKHILQSHEVLFSTVVGETGKLLIHHLLGIVTDLAL
jgi:hypothetical protein